MASMMTNRPHVIQIGDICRATSNYEHEGTKYYGEKPAVISLHAQCCSLKWTAPPAAQRIM